MAALDIREKQILVRYDQDANFTWHHRVLLRKVVGTTSWAVATPTLEVEILDVGNVQFVALARGRPITAAQRTDCFIFDPITARELSDAHAQARLLVEVFGDAPVADDEGGRRSWA